MTRLLFVYGSLRSQESEPARHLHQGSDLVGPAYVHGHLTDVQGFPGLVVGRAGRIEGELRLIRDDALWAELDKHEGVGDEGWYIRQLVVAIDKNGDPRSAWAYTSPQP